MLTPSRLFRRLRALLTRRRFDADVEEEIRFHLEMEAAKQQARGLAPAAATSEASRRFGSTTVAREEVRDAHGLTPVDDLRRDLRFAARSLARAPAYTAVALLTLALGIGGTIAVFTLVNATLIQPLPFHDPGRIMAVRGVTREGQAIPVSVPNFLDWKQQNHSFDLLATYNTRRGNLLGGNDPQRVSLTTVSGEFFPILGVMAMAGRSIAPADQTGDHPATIVLSYGLWRRAFGGDTGIVGRHLSLGDGSDYLVAGIMPGTFDFPQGTEVWASRSFQGVRWTRNAINDQVIGRLRNGTTLQSTRQEMDLIAARLKAAFPNETENQTATISVRPLAEELSDGIRTYLLLVQVSVLFVLLVGCANLASAGLARGIQREREMGLRTALGASRGRLLRQLLTEHLLVGVAGGLLGLGLALVLLKSLVLLAPAGLLPLRDLAPDLTVVVTALALSVIVGLGIGLLPAILGSRLELRSALGSAGGGSSRRRAGAGWALVSAEIGLSLMLLIGAGLLIHSFGRVLSEDPGARMEDVLTAEVFLPRSRYPTPETGLVFWERLLDRVRAAPGVRSAAAASAIPLGLGTSGYLEIEGQEGTPTGGYRLVTDDYFKTMDLHLLRGRGFTTADDSTHPHVTIINQAMADKYWKGQDPVGRRFRAKSWDWHPDVWLTVIGVVNNVRYWTLEAKPEPEHFVYFRQRPDRLQGMTLVAHTAGDPAEVSAAVRSAFRQTDPDVPADVSTMTQKRDDTLRQRRFIMTLLGGFAAFALLLAAIGIYGVLSYVTASRTREIGVRIALGARRQGVLALVMRQAASPVLWGVLAGLGGALALSRLMDALLYGISARDAFTFLAAPPVLVLVAAAACVVPARRALRIDPMVAIRSD